MLGCTRANMYRASKLPTEYIAQPHSVVQDLDLSRLSRTVGNSQVLNIGDEIGVSIATGLERYLPPSWKGRVGEDGSINVPLVGVVQVAGLELTQAEQVIRQESIRRGKFIDPNVTISLTQRRTNTIAVVGEVNRPNTYKLAATHCDLLTAIVEAGGLAKGAGTIVEIRYPPGVRKATLADLENAPAAELVSFNDGQRMVHTSARTTRVDLELASNSDHGDYLLPDGATVMVMKRPSRIVHTMGLVRSPKRHTIPNDQADMRVLDAIALSGGRTTMVADKVFVIRQAPNQSEPIVIQTSIRSAKRNAQSNIRLTDGDVVSIEETPATVMVALVQKFVNVGLGLSYSSAIPGF